MSAKFIFLIGPSTSDRETEALRLAEGIGAVLHRFPEAGLMPAEVLAWSERLNDGRHHIVVTTAAVLILRMARLIRCGVLAADDVECHVHSTEGWVVLRRQDDDWGGSEGESWPGGFFPEGVMEVFGPAMDWPLFPADLPEDAGEAFQAAHGEEVKHLCWAEAEAEGSDLRAHYFAKAKQWEGVAEAALHLANAEGGSWEEVARLWLEASKH